VSILLEVTSMSAAPDPTPTGASTTLAARSGITRWRWPVIGTLLAIAATAVMDVVGLVNVLPLVLLFLLFWYLQHLSRAEIGWTWGRWRDYALAVFYPLLVLGLVGLIAWLSGAVKLATIDWFSTVFSIKNGLVLYILTNGLGALVTEEGFFRGWLWASLRRAGVTARGVLVWTSVAFAAWHVSTALLPTAFHPPLAQVPIYIANAGVIGFIWALMRQRSGSIVVTSVSHGVWNGLVYVLFSTGTTLGALGIHNTGVFGPEVGWVGLALNVAFAAVLWLGFSRGRASNAVEMTQPTA
jgi:membrane protease YdiL (CAAX protease family)